MDSPSPDFAWSWSAQPELNDRSLHSPIPCKHGAEHCVYQGCCLGVHKGEEGTGRKFFPARLVEMDGKKVWQNACVRLIGSPDFYERRRLGLSWPQWCARKGLPAPMHREAAARLAAERKQRIQLVVPAPAPAPQQVYFPQITPAQVAYYQQMAAAHYQAILAQHQAAMASHQAQQAAAAQAAGVPAWFFPYLNSNRVQQNNVIGERLYVIIKDILGDQQATLEAAGLWDPKINAGRITGMLLEGMEIPELVHLVETQEDMADKMAECAAIIKEAAAAGTI
jgi:hypothetical protein